MALLKLGRRRMVPSTVGMITVLVAEAVDEDVVVDEAAGVAEDTAVEVEVGTAVADMQVEVTTITTASALVTTGEDKIPNKRVVCPPTYIVMLSRAARLKFAATRLCRNNLIIAKVVQFTVKAALQLF